MNKVPRISDFQRIAGANQEAERVLKEPPNLVERGSEQSALRNLEQCRPGNQYSGALDSPEVANCDVGKRGIDPGVAPLFKRGRSSRKEKQGPPVYVSEPSQPASPLKVESLNALGPIVLGDGDKGFVFSDDSF